VPSQEIAACRAAHLRLFASVEGLPPSALTAPSRLPGWSVAHLLTHVARNADSVVRRLEGAREGRLIEQYVGGAAARSSEVHAGAARDPQVVLRDVVDASEAVDREFASCPDDVSEAPVLLGTGEQRPAAHLAVSGWREVEVHHVDLGGPYGHRDWDDAFVCRFLPDVLQSLSSLTDAAGLLAWGLPR
jgi:maleylpyruvate isomerase